MPIKISSLLKSGLKPDPTDERDFSFSTYVPPEEVAIKIATALPSSVDYTAEMSPVKYQGAVGTCTAFSVAALKEWQERKEDIEEVKSGKDYKRKTDFYNFSEQWIYWNCKKIDSWPGQEGSDLRSAMKVLNKIGVPTEEAWPYIPSLTNIGEPKKWANLIARWSVIGSYWRLNNLDEVKRALVESPIVIAIPLFEDFYRMPNKTGILPMPRKNSPVLGWHALCCVAFFDDIQCVKIKNSWSCYDEKTEVLTDRGFKFFKDLDKTEKIATLNSNGFLEYNVPDNYIKYYYEGDMYKFKNSKIDLFVTPNHNMYISSLFDKNNNHDFKLMPADKIKNKHIMFKRDAKWDGEEKEFFILPEINTQINKSKSIVLPSYPIKMDDWLEFMGYWLSEGSLAKMNSKRGGAQYAVIISQSKKENLTKIKECLTRLNMNFFKTGHNFVFYNKQIYVYLREFGKSYEKYISYEFKQLGERQLKILFDALMLGDGSITVGKNGSKKLAYYTSSKKLSDDFQEICLKIGYCTTITEDNRVGKVRLVKEKSKDGKILNRKFTYNHISYRINIQNTQSSNFANTILRNPIEKNIYNGNVYCVDVKNHVIFVRRNGRVCWCGNCFWGNRGYINLPYDYINEYMGDAWTAKDIKVTRDMLKGTRSLIE